MRRLPLVLGLLALIAVFVAGWFYLRPAPKTPPVSQEAVATLALRNFALNLDPATMAETESRKVATLLYSGLVAVDPAGKVEPRLASAWTKTDDRTWTFTLIQGATFSNGTPVTADKVVASLCASLQPSHTQSWSMASIERGPVHDGKVKCTGLTALDPQTVQVRETRPTPWLLEALAGPGGWIVDVNEKTGAYGVRSGTGPYRVDKVTPEDSVVLLPRAGGAPRAGLSRVTFRYVRDDNVAAAAFARGELDLLEITTPNLASTLLQADGAPKGDAKVYRHPTDAVRVVAFNLDRLRTKGMAQGQIRSFLRAYAATVDRPAIAGRTNGVAAPMLSPFPPAQGAALVAPGSDLTPASGSLVLLTENDPFSDLIGAQLPKQVAGRQFAYQAVDKGLLINALLKGDYDLALVRIESTHHNPKFWTAFFTPGDPYVAFGHPIHALPAVDVSTPQGVQQAAGLVEAQGNWVGVLRESGVYVTSKRLSGVRLTPSGQLSLEEIRPAR